MSTLIKLHTVAGDFENEETVLVVKENITYLVEKQDGTTEVNFVGGGFIRVKESFFILDNLWHNA